MNIDGVSSGIVLDHITAGRSMDIYHYLHLEELDCCVAIIKNVPSRKMGKKDILKIDSPIDIDLDVLGYIDPNITVNIIVGGKIVEKKRIAPPDEVIDVVKCKNPRCITSVERELPQIFRRSVAEEVYRCAYCEQEYQPVE